MRTRSISHLGRLVVAAAVAIASCESSGGDPGADGASPDALAPGPDSGRSPDPGGCQRDCTNRECGPDPVCGILCGLCPGAAECVEGQCVEPRCAEDCTGLECGPGPVCGASCGSCMGAQVSCIAGQCQCQPDCGGRQCGDDGCGGQCGVCNQHPASFCDPGGHCACTADCTGRVCGDDGCGGSCGACSDAQVCSGEGQCTGYCSGHGQLMTWGDERVCACASGFTPSSREGLDCVVTTTICKGGPIDFDVDGDGTRETWFDPSPIECEMFELVNYTRATHDPEGQPECHFPLGYNVEWSAHGRNHSKQMYEANDLWHDDWPSGQNCAYGRDPAGEMDMYMTGPDEPHCPELSHHCNIMRCSFSQIGIGYWTPDHGTFNTQNFL